jgi:glyoxylase-like metal-dependent hydrolase (beta-lactamase superfamily II)
MPPWNNAPPGLHPIRGATVTCHLLVDGRDAWVLDTGLIGEPLMIRRKLRRLGLDLQSIRGIVLTHGHLDHAGNLALLQRWTGAPVYGHPLEQIHVDGRFPYTGIARWCGRLEAFGRWALRYRAGQIDEFFGDGDELPVWGGLRVVHLPGHSDGHCGFYSARHDLLFSSDLFVSYLWPHLPPPILNSRPERIPDSLRKAARLDARWIVPNHYDFFDGALHRRRFDGLCRRLLGRPVELGTAPGR